MLRVGTKPEEASSCSARPPPSPPWNELPDDLTANILQRLYTEEILKSAQKVCTLWWRVCKNPAMWRVIDLDSRCFATEEEFENTCRWAVDRSQGQLVELKLAYFEGGGLPNYVADRSSQLRCMTLECCEILSPTVLTKAIQKLPLLEELHLMMWPTLSPKDFETIGISCRGLNSFTYNHCLGGLDDFSMHAVAIGENMPNLHHLRLCDHHIKDEGLEAILDGCPHLESLDLGGCTGLDLQGALGKRCSDQISDLRFVPL